MNDHSSLDAAEDPSTLGTGAKSIARVAAAALIVLLLVLMGVAIGANLWPHVANVEQRVVEPVRLATAGHRGLESIPNTVDQACEAIALLRSANAANAAKLPPPKGKTKRQSHRKGVAKAAASDQMVGFFVTADGYILTAASAIADGPVEAVLSDGQVLPAAKVGSDPLSGLTLFKVTGSGFSTLPFSDDGYPRIGQTGLVVAPGRTGGCVARTVFVANDFINENRGLRSYVSLQEQLDANWAGVPVLDLDGRVVGIAGLNLQADQDGDTTQVLPGSIASHVAGQLVRDGTSPANRFGFEAEDLGPSLADRLDSDPGGAVVSLVEQASAAGKAGLKAGDIIQSVDDQPVSSASELARALDARDAGLNVQIQRHGEQQVVTLAVAAPPT